MKQKDPESDIKKAVKNYKRSERMELPARTLNAASLGALISSISAANPTLGVHLAGELGAVEAGTTEIASSAITDFQEYKREKIFEKISEYDGVLTSATIDEIESLPFVFELTKTLELINRLANDKKLNFICNCFGTYFLEENHGEDVDQYEEFLDLLSTLSYREIEILITYYNIKQEILDEYIGQEDQEKKTRDSICEKSTIEINRIALEKWNLNKGEMRGVLTSLCRSGFLSELSGTILGNAGGNFYTTEYFEQFLRYILPANTQEMRI